MVLLTACAALLGSMAACAGTSAAPNTASDPTVVAGAPTPGQASQGQLTVRVTAITRSGNRLSVAAQVHNAAKTPEELQSIGSQVTATLTLTPPLQIPAGATRELGGGGRSVVLVQNARLEPGGTVALMLNFRRAGAVQVFSGFQ